MLLEAQARRWEIHYMELGDLFLRNGKAYARTRCLSVQPDPLKWFDFVSEQTIDLGALDVTRRERSAF
jgi:glutathione synthase